MYRPKIGTWHVYDFFYLKDMYILLAVKHIETHLQLLVRPRSVHVWIFEIYLETQSSNFRAADAHHFHAVMDPAIRVDACYLLERHLFYLSIVTLAVSISSIFFYGIHCTWRSVKIPTRRIRIY
jgi:hypothetical protein